MNGINTQGENIADNGGIKESYLAYQRWTEENEPEPRLPGLDYSPQQMFWISAAQTWCSVYRPGNLYKNMSHIFLLFNENLFCRIDENENHNWCSFAGSIPCAWTIKQYEGLC